MGKMWLWVLRRLKLGKGAAAAPTPVVEMENVPYGQLSFCKTCHRMLIFVGRWEHYGVQADHDPEPYHRAPGR